MRARNLGVEHSPDHHGAKKLRNCSTCHAACPEEHMADPDEKELLDRGEFVELLCRLALLVVCGSGPAMPATGSVRDY